MSFILVFKKKKITLDIVIFFDAMSLFCSVFIDNVLFQWEAW